MINEEEMLYIVTDGINWMIELMMCWIQYLSM